MLDLGLKQLELCKHLEMALTICDDTKQTVLAASIEQALQVAMEEVEQLQDTIASDPKKQ
jgi:hypothetical protein